MVHMSMPALLWHTGLRMHAARVPLSLPRTPHRARSDLCCPCSTKHGLLPALASPSPQLSVLLGDKSAKDCSRIDRRAPLRRLEAWLAKEQQRTGLPLALPLAELKLAGCHLLHRGALQLLKQRIIGAEARGQQGGRLPDHIALEAAMSATQSLLHTAPKEGRPNALMCLAELFMVGQQPDEAAKAYRMALGRAAEVKGGEGSSSCRNTLIWPAPGLCLHGWLPWA